MPQMSNHLLTVVCPSKLHALRNAVECSIDSGDAGVPRPVAQQSIPEYKIEIRYVWIH